MATLTPSQAMSAAMLLAEQKFPYFITGLASLARRPAPGLGTFGVTKGMVLLYDPEVLDKWTTEETAGVIVHELLHVLRNHAQRCMALVADPKCWNFAADMELNDDLVGHIALPGGHLLPKMFGFDNGKLAEEYYALLQQKAQQQQQQQQSQSGQGERSADEDGEGSSESEDSDDDENEEEESDGSGGGSGAEQEQENKNGGSSGEDKSDSTSSSSGNGSGETDKPAAGAGWCGSGAGRPVPGEPEETDKANRPQAEVEQIQRDTAAEVKEYAAKNGRGSVPGGMLVWADSVLKPPKIRWQDKLRRSVRSAVAYRSGMQDYTYARMSRKQPALNAFMARLGKRSPIVPAMHAPVINAAIGIDTSGSMGSEQLIRAASESQAVLRHIGTPCAFIACDAQVHGGVTKVSNAKQLCARLHGGGGTDFVPLFAAVEKLRPRPDILVFITDGYGPAPAVAPKGVHTIFVLVGPYRRKPTNCETCEEIGWGEFVEVNEDEQQ